MKLACPDYTFPLLPHSKALELIAMLGFDSVDIGFFEDRSHFRPKDVLGHAAESGGSLASLLREKGLAAADLFLQTALDFESTAINHPDKAVRTAQRETFRKTADLAGYVNARHLTILPGIVFSGEQEEMSWARAQEELQWRVEETRSRGLTLGIEAHIGSLCADPRKARELVSRVNGLTLTLDYTHFTKLGFKDEEIEILVPYASHVHVRGACKGKGQVKASRNTIDYARVTALLKKNGYSGYMVIEYVWTEWEDMNEVDNVSETILMRDFLKQQIQAVESKGGR